MRYSRWERLHFKLFGRWPQAVVDRRLVEWETKKRAMPENVRRILDEVNKK